MSHFSNPRIRRGSGPSGALRDHNVRQRDWEHLLRDFESRCAYSMRHIRMAGGERQMEVDHFNPKHRGKARNAYKNLMLATRHCNLKKRNYWPTLAEQQSGYRILN